MAMDSSEILNLSNILQENGDRILNGISKLSLSAELLQTISSEFTKICDSEGANAAFEVLSPHHGQSPTVRHLEFLHDFFQKTLGLKIVQSWHKPLSEVKIDLSKFKNLKYLELKRVPVKHLIGLKIVQPHLECIICERGLTTLEQLLAECGSDNSTGFVWSELKEAVLSFNDIKIVDTSVAFAPWLQILDLSHNQISDVKAIECLPNLKYVNLSFNSLSAIPVFNKSARKKVEVLVLKHNYIEDLIGLSGLDYLKELDVSSNWICSNQSFYPLLTMGTLQWLSLEGNPVCNLPNYRSSVIGFLHISASFGNLVLDRVELTKKERSRVGIELTSQAHRNKSSGIPSVAKPVPGPSSGFHSEVHDGGNVPEKPTRRSGKVRLAVIPNLDDGTFEEVHHDLNIITVQGVDNDHLETKKQIESARKMHKENWLRCEGAGLVQNILGLPQVAPSSTPYDDSCLTAALNDSSLYSKPVTSDDNSRVTFAVIEPVPQDVDSGDDKPTDKNTEDSFLSCNEDNASAYFSMDSSNDAPKESKETSPDIETITDSSDDRDDESQERLYLVTRVIQAGSGVSRQELFLSLTPTEIRERDTSHGRTVGSWSLASLESVTRPRDGELRLVFDTVRRDRWERLYELVVEEAEELYTVLQKELQFVAQLKLQEDLFCCISCSNTFVVEKRSLKYNVKAICPSCGSKMILQANDLEKERKLEGSGKPQPTVKLCHNRSSSTGVADVITSQKMKKCASRSSLGSTASLDEKILPTAALIAKGFKCESDIEIISNPSQSSIEVIDGPRLHGISSPERKQSLEEKQAPSVTVTQVSAFAGLTESSSSGSGTDSVCTAYENSSMVSSDVSKRSGLENSVLIEEGNETMDKHVLVGKDFEHMLQEVLKNVGAKENKPSRSEIEKDIDTVKYSYQHFDQLDHRIKLYLYVHLFDDNSEEFVFLIRCQLLLPNVEGSFEACVVSSNRKLYVLKITGKEEGEEASKFLSKVDNLTVNLSNLKKWGILAWHQGFFITFRSHPNEYIILLKNPKWTSNFQNYVAAHDAVFPSHVEWSAEPIPGPHLRFTQFLLAAAEDTSLLGIVFFVGCSIVGNKESRRDYHEGALAITPTDLFIVSTLSWVFNSVKNNIPSACNSQKLSDLIQTGVTDRELCLQFLDESQGKQQQWVLTLASKELVNWIVDAIKLPWEDLFSVPLHVSYT